MGTDLINNGVLDFYINGNRNVGITFTGNADASFTLNAGSTTDLRQDGVILNKGTSNTPVLTFTPGGTFTVQGGNSLGFLSITNGTFKISGTGTFSNPVFNTAAYAIPATGGFWLDNPNYTVVGLNGSPTNNGLLRVSQGIFDVGTASGNAMGAGAGAIFIIEGGTVDFAGRLNTANAVTYTQSAGTVNITTVGNSTNNMAGFGLTSGSSVFNMSGGAINLVRASTAGTPIDYQVSGTANITGGTLNVGTAATASNFNFRISGQAPNVVVDNTTHNKTATLIAQTNVWGNTTIPTGATMVLNGFTLQQIGTTFTNNGTLNGTVANSALYFFGSAAQTYTGTGTTTAPLANFGVDNAFGLTLSFDPDALSLQRSPKGLWSFQFLCMFEQPRDKERSAVCNCAIERPVVGEGWCRICCRVKPLRTIVAPVGIVVFPILSERLMWPSCRVVVLSMTTFGVWPESRRL